MADNSFLQELACNHCGAPIRTTAVRGATVTCDCCGSAFVIPNGRPEAGIVVDNAVVQGDVVLGDKIVAGRSVVIVGKDAVAKIQPVNPDEDVEANGPGEGP